jgi:hypothetical protein
MRRNTEWLHMQKLPHDICNAECYQAPDLESAEPGILFCKSAPRQPERKSATCEKRGTALRAMSPLCRRTSRSTSIGMANTYTNPQIEPQYLECVHQSGSIRGPSHTVHACTSSNATPKNLPQDHANVWVEYRDQDGCSHNNTVEPKHVPDAA